MASAYPPDRADNPRPPAAPLAADKSLSELFSTMTAELGTLVHQEIALAKVETKEEVGHAAKAAGLLGGAALTGWMAWLFASLALTWLLDQWINRALAFAIVGVLYATVAGALFTTGRARAKHIDPVPRQTVETLKEDAEWAKAQRN
jgi:ABC-type uncharacterized transport system permease subunit